MLKHSQKSRVGRSKKWKHSSKSEVVCPKSLNIRKSLFLADYTYKILPFLFSYDTKAFSVKSKRRKEKRELNTKHEGSLKGSG